MKTFPKLALSLAVTASLAAPAWTCADVVVIGALSNCDVPNNTNEPCDEFEIELEGPHPEDCTGFWSNFNYGMPTMRANAAGTGIVVNYARAGRTTAIGAIEHFGVRLRNFNIITARTFRWKHNGVVVASGAGSPPIPIPTTNVVPTPTGEAMETEVENETPDRVIWVRRSTIAVPREVALGELMPDDPLILAATPLEVETEKLEPGETLVALDPLEPNDDYESLVFVVETFDDVATWNPATQSWDHRQGALVSRAMNATVIERPACTDVPVITSDPVDAQPMIGAAANLYVVADTPAAGGEAFYRWRHNGVELPLEDNPRLEIDPVTVADVGVYSCVITNDCGTTESMAAWVTLCPADFNVSGSLSVQDVFDFLSAYFGNMPSADVNHSGTLGVQDVFDYLALYFGGCS